MGSRQDPAVLIVDDDGEYAGGLAKRFLESMPCLEVRCVSKDLALETALRLKAEGYDVVFAIISDIVGSPRGCFAGAQRGILELLSALKVAMGDDVFCVWLGDRRGPFDLAAFQLALDKGLVQHFMVKPGGSLFADRIQAVADKVVSFFPFLFSGCHGNVPVACLPFEFRMIVRQWIRSLPDGGETEMLSPEGEGRVIRAGELLTNLSLFSVLSRFACASNPDALSEFVKGLRLQACP